jgi:hypothetical protein
MKKRGAMYTGRSIEDLLELVLGLVERVGEVVFVAPTTTASPPKNSGIKEN